MRISDWSSDVCSSDLLEFRSRKERAADFLKVPGRVNQYFRDQIALFASSARVVVPMDVYGWKSGSIDMIEPSGMRNSWSAPGIRSGSTATQALGLRRTKAPSSPLPFYTAYNTHN